MREITQPFGAHESAPGDLQGFEPPTPVITKREFTEFAVHLGAVWCAQIRVAPRLCEYRIDPENWISARRSGRGLGCTRSGVYQQRRFLLFFSEKRRRAIELCGAGGQACEWEGPMSRKETPRVTTES